MRSRLLAAVAPLAGAFLLLCSAAPARAAEADRAASPAPSASPPPSPAPAPALQWAGIGPGVAAGRGGPGEPWPRNDVIPGDGIYHSTDGGKSWAHLGLAQTSQIARVLLDPHDAKRVLVAALGDPFRDSAERGVFRSTDGGATWTKTLYAGPSVGASDLAMDPKNPDVLYAGMWRFRRSAWNLTSGGDDDGIYKSTDGGATWKRVTGNGLPAGVTGRIALAIAP